MILIAFLAFSMFAFKNTSYGLSYLNDSEIFNAEIVHVNSLKAPYSLLMEFSNTINETLSYNVEIVYKRTNEIVQSEVFDCGSESSCEKKFEFQGIYYDDYEVHITVAHLGTVYNQDLPFSFTKAETKNFFVVDEEQYIEVGKVPAIRGEIYLENSSKVRILAISDVNNAARFETEVDCEELICSFELPMTRDVLFGVYSLQGYTETDNFGAKVSLLFDTSRVVEQLPETSKKDKKDKGDEEEINQTEDSDFLDESVFTGNFTQLFTMLEGNQTLRNHVYFLECEDSTQDFYLNGLIYNYYKIIEKINWDYKANFFAKFSSSQFTILYSEGLEASIDTEGMLQIDNFFEDEGYIVLSSFDFAQELQEQNLSFSDLLNDLIFVKVVKNEDESQVSLSKKILLPQKFSDSSFEVEVQVDTETEKKLARVDNKLTRLMNKDAVSKNTLKTLLETSDELNASLQISGRDIRFSNLKLDESGLGLRAKKVNKEFSFEDEKTQEKITLKDIFAIDPEGIDFESATMNRVAKGTALYKCKDWDYDSETCMGTWKKIRDLTPGVEYALELDKYDPAFAELNIIFEDDFEQGGAFQSGFWTTRTEDDSQLTGKWDIDTQYKYEGSYSLSNSPGKNYDPGVPSNKNVPHISVITPPLNLSGLVSANATFYQRVFLEEDGTTSCYDAVFPFFSTDGSSWTPITITGYSQRNFHDWFSGQPYYGDSSVDGYAICGQYTTWTQVSIDLTPYVGNQTFYLRWSMTSDDNTAFDGYNLDNFVVYGVENQNPVIVTAPSFNPSTLILGEDTYLNMSITDESEVNVIGTVSYQNGTKQNYSLLPEIKNKTKTYSLVSTQTSEKGENVTVFSDTFSSLKYWFITIGTNMFDWDILGGGLHVDGVTAPRPQYATLVPPVDLRNFSEGEILYQYKDSGSLEGNDCLLFSLFDGSSWSADSVIFCNDLPLDNTYYGGNISLNSSYMTKDFQMRFGADQFDNTGDDAYIDNFFLYAWQRESQTTGRLFEIQGFDNFTEIDRINVTILVDSYNPVASVVNANLHPDLYLSLNDGSVQGDEFSVFDLFSLNNSYLGSTINATDKNFTLSITDPTLIDYWISHPDRRFLRIGAANIDYSSSLVYDEIVYKALTISIEGKGTNNNYYYNFSNVQLPGTHNLTHVYITDFFGQSTNQTYTAVNFSVAAYSKIETSYLSQNNIQVGDPATMNCKVVDNSTGNPLGSYTVLFYKNSTYLGANLTNASGIAVYTFPDSSVADSLYNITCNITDSPTTFYTVTEENSSSDLLAVWLGSADIEKPAVFAGGGSPVLNNVGLGFNAWVNATDNVKVEKVYLYVKRPGEVSYSGYLMSSPGTLNGSGQYTYTYTQDSIAGTYYYYFRAEDNWTIPNWNETVAQTFSRVVADALIKINNDGLVYKSINDVGIERYTVASLSNSTPGEQSAYIGPYFVFNNSFADEFASWTSFANPSGVSLYSGNGGVGYERLDNDLTAASSRTPGTDDSAAKVSMESSTYSLGGSGYSYFEKALDLGGYTSANVSFYLADNDVDTMVSGDYPFSLEVYDGIWYQAYTQQGVNNGDTTITAADYVYKNVELGGYQMVDNFKIRFSGGGYESTNDDFLVDDVLVTASAEDETSLSQVYGFGNQNLNLSFFTVKVFVSAYDNTGSTLNDEPDLSVEFYNGSEYIDKEYCGLEALYGFSQSFSVSDVNCSVMMTDPDLILAWENPANRKIRVNAEYVDVSLAGSDNINWTGVSFEYYTPSLLFNPGIINITSYLSNRIYYNATNELKGTVNITQITIENNSLYNLSQSWNAATMPLIDLPNGVYYSSSALTDGSGNIIMDSQGREIVSTDYFEIQNMYVNITSPVQDQTYASDVLVNVTLDTTFYASGGHCNYSLNSQSPVAMTQDNSTQFSAIIPLTNFTFAENSVIVYCDDSAGDLSVSKNVSFNVDTGFVVKYVAPTEANNSIVSLPYTDINVSIETLETTSGYIDFNKTLLAYYNFENYSGTDLSDYSSYGNTAYLNATQINKTGNIRGNFSKFNSSLQASVSLPSPSESIMGAFSGDSDFSVSMFINPNRKNVGAGVVKEPLFELFNSSSTYLSYGLQSASGTEEVYFVVSRFGINQSFYSGDLNWENMTWQLLTITGKEINSSHLNVSVYLNSQYKNSSAMNKSLFLDTDAALWIGKSVPFSSYFNGSLDEIFIEGRALYDQEISALNNSKIHILDINYTNLLNGNYSFEACGITKKGLFLCADERFIFINKTLPQITINTPINNSNINYSEDVYVNVSISEEVANVWYSLFSDPTNVSLQNVSLFDWNGSFSDLGGSNAITVYTRDDIGNLVSKTHYFYKVHEKLVSLEKGVSSLGVDSYLVVINFTNNGEWKNYSLYDFVDRNFTYYDVSPVLDGSSGVGGVYTGDLLRWNFSLNKGESQLVTYKVNGSSSGYKLKKAFIGSLD